MSGTVTDRALRVKSVTWEAENVVSIQLEDPHGLALESWDPGAHLDLTLPSGVQRQYSLCGAPGTTDRYRIAVLREELGRGGSIEVHDQVLVGRELRVRGPRNHFPLAQEPHYLLVAGGIGVTPILAMARRLEQDGQDWRLVYGGRSRRSMAFLDELDALSAKRVTVVPQDELGIPDLRAAIDELPAGAGVYCCGPDAMIRAAEAIVQTRGDLQFHAERFTVAVSSEPVDTSDDQPFTVRLDRSGVELEVPVGTTLLDVVREVVPDYPFNCEEGYCGSCETVVLDGIPDHRDDLLTDEEKATGEVMMICVGRSFSPRITLDI